MTFQSTHIYKGETQQSYAYADQEKTEQQLALAASVYEQWRKSNFAIRAVHMLSLSDLLKERREDLAIVISTEMGKHIKESRAEIDKCVLCCDFYAENADIFLKRDRLVVSDGRAYMEFNPLGLVFAVMPWNFPFWQVFRFAVPAVMAGNVCMLKHAVNVPQCSLLIEELFNQAGFPDGIVQNIFLSHEQVPAIIADDRVKAVTLTGSEDAGRAVASVTGKALKKSVMELGGSDPFIVLKDADTEKAAKVGAYARLINSGQSCIAAKRFIIERDVFIPFLDMFINHMQSYKFGDPLDESNDFGCMARGDLVDKLHGQVSESLKMGAKLVIGGEVSEKHPLIYKPTILTDVKPGMPAYEEELFGPVAVVMSVDSAEDAVRVANDTKYGLGSSLWTENINIAEKMVADIECGAVYINKMMASHPAVPFGGIKYSGYGRELSQQGIREFVNQKTVWRA